jgi:AcrR family transcriptional regulator
VKGKQRAEPLAADDRRRAIVQAVIPLLVRQGAAVTTREMAEAAGVAEGTIFRVFPDKCALIHHAIEVSMDPAPIERGLAEIYPVAPLAVQLVEASHILLERFDEMIALMSVMRTMPPDRSHHPSGLPTFVAESNAAVMGALTALFERNRENLRVEPGRAAAAFRGLIFARAHPTAALEEKLTVAEIVGVLLSGVAHPAHEGVV